MSIPSGYDAVTLNHWLWYKYQCHEGSPAEFQRLFENIIKRARPEFIQIRPYGNIGDRKCDGLFYVDDCSSVFQVYSPDELKQSEVQAKIDEDLAGAIEHWKDLNEWTFVYNARRGLAPDIPGTLAKKKQQHSNLRIDHLSSDALWELARNLTLQQRCEILGAPNGYEHIFFSQSTTPGEVAEQLKSGHLVLVQDLLSPISLAAVVEALDPSKAIGAPALIRPVYKDLPWKVAAKEQRTFLNEALSKGRETVPRFAVFSLAPIPLAIHLGFVLSDRVEVNCFQFQRDRFSWTWPTDAGFDSNLKITGIPSEASDSPIEVSIAIALSAVIDRRDVEDAAPRANYHLEICVDNPDVMWLKSPAQLSALALIIRTTLSTLRTKFPRCSRIHIFYAGPTGGAVVLGQQINPRMNPPVELYQYSMQSSPRYQPALTLTEELS